MRLTGPPPPPASKRPTATLPPIGHPSELPEGPLLTPANETAVTKTLSLALTFQVLVIVPAVTDIEDILVAPADCSVVPLLVVRFAYVSVPVEIINEPFALLAVSVALAEVLTD